MDTKKLDRWACLLLEAGKRNNLINFKDTKAATVEALLPQAETLFRKIDGTAAAALASSCPALTLPTDNCRLALERVISPPRRGVSPRLEEGSLLAYMLVAGSC